MDNDGENMGSALQAGKQSEWQNRLSFLITLIICLIFHPTAFLNWCRMIGGRSSESTEACVVQTKEQTAPKSRKKRSTVPIKSTGNTNYPSDRPLSPIDFLDSRMAVYEHHPNKSLGIGKSVNGTQPHVGTVPAQAAITVGIALFGCLTLFALIMVYIFARKGLARNDVGRIRKRRSGNQQQIGVPRVNTAHDTSSLNSLVSDKEEDSMTYNAGDAGNGEMLGFNQMDSPKAGWQNIRAKFVTVDELRQGLESAAGGVPSDGDYVRVQDVRNGFLVIEQIEELDDNTSAF